VKRPVILLSRGRQRPQEVNYEEQNWFCRRAPRSFSHQSLAVRGKEESRKIMT